MSLLTALALGLELCHVHFVVFAMVAALSRTSKYDNCQNVSCICIKTTVHTSQHCLEFELESLSAHEDDAPWCSVMDPVLMAMYDPCRSCGQCSKYKSDREVGSTARSCARHRCVTYLLSKLNRACCKSAKAAFVISYFLETKKILVLLASS